MHWINKHMIHGVIRSDWIISFAQALPSIFTSSSKQHTSKWPFHPLDRNLASTKTYHFLVQLSHYSKYRKQNARTDFRFLTFNFRRDLYVFSFSICLNCHFFFCLCCWCMLSKALSIWYTFYNCVHSTLQHKQLIFTIYLLIFHLFSFALFLSFRPCSLGLSLCCSLGFGTCMRHSLLHTWVCVRQCV